jgi:hypothetical protein
LERLVILLPPVVFPISFGGLNVASLRFLVSANQQQDDFGTIFCKVNSISGTEIDSEFSDALPDWLTVPEVSLLETIDPNSYNCTPFAIAQTI